MSDELHLDGKVKEGAEAVRDAVNEYREYYVRLADGGTMFVPWFLGDTPEDRKARVKRLQERIDSGER